MHCIGAIRYLGIQSSGSIFRLDLLRIDTPITNGYSVVTGCTAQGPDSQSAGGGASVTWELTFTYTEPASSIPFSVSYSATKTEFETAGATNHDPHGSAKGTATTDSGTEPASVVGAGNQFLTSSTSTTNYGLTINSVNWTIVGSDTDTFDVIVTTSNLSGSASLVHPSQGWKDDNGSASTSTHVVINSAS